METIAGGKGRKAPPRELVSKKERKVEIADDDLPTTISVKPHGTIKGVVPGHVWRVTPFKWDPVTFATESEQLNNKFIEPIIQDRSLRAFMEFPDTPVIYGISGNPDDSKAKYFAAFLVAQHLRKVGPRANVVWLPMYGGFDNPWMSEDKASPTMLVLTNLTPNSTSLKIEKTRDLIEKYSDIPRIVVCAGMDPMSFLATRLYVPINALAYFSEGLVKTRVEVI